MFLLLSFLANSQVKYIRQWGTTQQNLIYLNYKQIMGDYVTKYDTTNLFNNDG